MPDSLTDVEGIEVGHAGDRDAMTGCTVVLARRGAVVGVDVRGSAPGTRETDLCRPGTLVESAHAVLLAGGSAFGLDAAGGVMRYLHGQGIGFPVGELRVPIVPAAVIFDLAVGLPRWPTDEMGERACLAAGSGEVEQGRVGAGTGATVGKALGLEQAVPGGVGSASVRVGDLRVGALMVVNAMGEVVDGDGTVLAGPRGEGGHAMSSEDVLLRSAVRPDLQNTTIGVVATDAALQPEDVSYLATVAHDGLARAIRPVHTLADGDTIFALATGEGDRLPRALLLSLGVAAVRATERAVRRAVLAQR